MFIPIGTERPRRRPTIVTYWLIGICCVIFMWQTTMNRATPTGSMSPAVSQFVLNFNPAVYSEQGNRVDVPLETLTTLGVPTDRPHRWYQYLTYQFLHGGWLHLLGNMLFL
ncbi:MAG: rhomboid family intramembrane serine protease, partial [Planctomycetota bacterium]